MVSFSIGKFLQRVTDRLNPPEWHSVVRSEADARRVRLSIATAQDYVVWEEPNRAQTPPLHIGKSGERFSTLTGVWWLDRQTMVVAHRSGLRFGVFDTGRFDRPVFVGEVPHPTDDIAAKPLEDDAWEVAVSGCWASIYSRFTLRRTAGAPAQWAMQPLDVCRSPTRDFCHGVAYDRAGQLCWSIHTGTTPRLAIGETVHRLPAPWGVRDLCEDRDHGRYLAIAVSKNPRQQAYDDVVTSIWQLADGAPGWHCLCALPGVHSDALEVWGERIWVPDQLNDRLLALDASTGEVLAIFEGDCFDFPHGLGISPDGVIAVTNYGSSSVVLLKAEGLIG